jgi:ComF family protein
MNRAQLNLSAVKRGRHMGTCVCCLSCFKTYRAIHDALCDDCYRLHQKTFLRCEGCARLLDEAVNDDFSLCADCVKHAVPQQYTVCAVSYHSLTGELIRQLKYHKKFFSVTQIAALMSENIMDHYQARLMPQLMLPVPLHYQKYNQRGFNQSELIAKKLSSLFNIALNHTLLTRTKATEKLENKTKSQRLKIMNQAFACDSLAHGIDHIALIDDVYTTGATTKACIKAIQQQNPKIQVDVWCYARTP